MSKAIYKPKGKAGEYAEWACNLYVGCSNDCDYCYCKRGVLGTTMGAPIPTLKKCFKDNIHAFEVFMKELEANLLELQKSSLFFTFSSDPMIEGTRRLNWECIKYAQSRGVRVQVLTKNATFLDDGVLKAPLNFTHSLWRKTLAWGFTLTGMDDMERGASTNEERMAAMKRLHMLGFRTFASFEPVVKPSLIAEMAEAIKDYCDLFKVGLMSGPMAPEYDKEELLSMVKRIGNTKVPTYLKHSLTDALGVEPMKPINIFDSFPLENIGEYEI